MNPDVIDIGSSSFIPSEFISVVPEEVPSGKKKRRPPQFSQPEPQKPYPRNLPGGHFSRRFPLSHRRVFPVKSLVACCGCRRRNDIEGGAIFLV
ncbi:hypothetical protein LINPERPRIM_LOCUS11896 [Linum perenne]